MNRIPSARTILVGALLVAVVSAVWIGGLAGPRAPKLPGGKPIRVEVLNGTNVPRAGLNVAQRLRDKGFDVVDIRTADDTRRDGKIYEHTLVLDRVDETRWAQAVAKSLGVSEVVRQRNDDLLLEVTVILGRDLAERHGGKK